MRMTLRSCTLQYAAKYNAKRHIDGMKVWVPQIEMRIEANGTANKLQDMGYRHTAMVNQQAAR